MGQPFIQKTEMRRPYSARTWLMVIYYLTVYCPSKIIVRFKATLCRRPDSNKGGQARFARFPGRKHRRSEIAICPLAA